MELSIPIGTEEGFEITSPFEDGVPSDPAELAESGSHEELLMKNGIYSRFVESRKEAVSWKL